jgi:uncharacterized protein YdcH (DUF465 family)
MACNAACGLDLPGVGSELPAADRHAGHESQADESRHRFPGERRRPLAGARVRAKRDPRQRPDLASNPLALRPLLTSSPRGAFAFQKEVTMFEAQPQEELEALMKSDAEFRQLLQRHRELDKQVLDAELGVLPLDDNTLSRMKREKLYAKDRLLRMYEAHH